MAEQLALAERPQKIAGPIELIQQALASGTSPDVIRELVALQQSMERFNWEREERQAKIDFDNALNECQKQIGRIAPNVNRKDTSSWWADYAHLDKTVRPIYTDAGFSIAFSEVEPISKGKVRIKASLSRGGISKDYFSEITPSTTGPKGGAMATATDADAIAASRAKRYLILAIFNVSVGIDKIEKDIEGLDISAYAPLMEAIEGAATISAVTAAYITALKGAKTEKEKQSFEDAAKKRKGELAR